MKNSEFLLAKYSLTLIIMCAAREGLQSSKQKNGGKKTKIDY